MAAMTTMPVSGDWTVDGRKVDGVPLLAVEVLSVSTRLTDTTLKRQVLEQAGVPSSWLLDPEVPPVTVLAPADLLR